MSRVSRRNLLKAAAGTAVLGFPAIIRAQQKEVVILGLWDQTGAFADVGPLNDRGMRMHTRDETSRYSELMPDGKARQFMGIALVPETRDVFSYLTVKENLVIAERPGSRWRMICTRPPTRSATAGPLPL